MHRLSKTSLLILNTSLLQLLPEELLSLGPDLCGLTLRQLQN